MAANELNLRRGVNDVYLKYNCRTEKCLERNDQIMFIPFTSITLNFDLKINGNQLYDQNYDSLVDTISNEISQSEYWKKLNFKVDTIVDDEFSFRIVIHCNIFNNIINEFLDLNNSGKITTIFDENIDVLREIHIIIEYQTEMTSLLLKEYLKDVNYVITSLLINLEYIFPLIFSVYGRQFFNLNYSNIKRVLYELKNDQINETQCESYILHQALIHNLMKVQARILTEFNIINVLKESDQSNYRSRVLRINKGKTSDTMAVKNFPYSLALIEINNK